MGRLAIPAFLTTMLLPALALAATLEIEVIGLASDAGDVHIAVYDNPAAFPDSDGMLTETQVGISAGRATLRIPDLEPGTYAIAVYHDENGNHDFDQGFLGIPLEDYGFSSGATAFFGPPSFDEAAFRVSGPETRIVIDVGG